MFNPRTIAFIGATEREGSVGLQIMKNLLAGGNGRKIYPVNPNRQSVLGIKCVSSVLNIDDHIDLAVIATPNKTVPKLVEECGQLGVDGVVIISAGFREIGFIRPHLGLNATFLRESPEPGEIAFISQSGGRDR